METEIGTLSNPRVQVQSFPLKLDEQHTGKALPLCVHCAVQVSRYGPAGFVMLHAVGGPGCKL